MTPKQEHKMRVEKSTRLRQEFAATKPVCPCCGQQTLSVLGGVGSFWLECTCGSYSALSETCSAALENVGGWQKIDPELNACMYPPIGGAK
jgi:hypothetical protein